MNLNTLIETNQKRKNMNHFFDKVWYEKRDQQLHSQEGFVFDGQGMVANSTNFKNATKSIQEMTRQKEINRSMNESGGKNLNTIVEEYEAPRSSRNHKVHI